MSNSSACYGLKLFLILATFLLFFALIDLANASSLPLLEKMSEDAENMIKEREIQNLKNRVYQKEYIDPETSTANMIMEMYMQNKKEERLKEEIKEELENENQSQPAQPIEMKTKDCSELLGENSKYDSLKNGCVCMEDFKEYKGKCLGKIEYGDEYCKDAQGVNFRFNEESDGCISNEDYCKGKLGENSMYLISEDKCICKTGYIQNENKCIEENGNNLEIAAEQPGKSESFGQKFIGFLKKIKFW